MTPPHTHTHNLATCFYFHVCSLALPDLCVTVGRVSRLFSARICVLLGCGLLGLHNVHGVSSCTTLHQMVPTTLEQYVFSNLVHCPPPHTSTQSSSMMLVTLEEEAGSSFPTAWGCLRCTLAPSAS